MAFVATTTLAAGWQSIQDNFIPLAHQPGKVFIGTLNAVLTGIMMGCALAILGAALRKIWVKLYADQPAAIAPFHVRDV
jgi:hypothetical protein